MKIKNFSATDMRAAMRAIRSELGPDAVILATESRPEGVMLTAAIDLDASVVAAPVAARLLERPPVQSVRSVSAPPDPALSEELRVLRRLLESQIAQLAWNDYSRRSPQAAELQREFALAGFAPELLRPLLDELPETIGLAVARRRLMVRLSDRLRATGDRWLQYGGRVALLGQSGVGKTSAALRLAAKWVQRHGNGDLAIVAMESGQTWMLEALFGACRSIAVPCYSVADGAELIQLLANLSDRRLVIVDTPGLGAQLPLELAPWRQLTATIPALELVLVAAANTGGRTIAALLQAMAPTRWQACVITKLDEAERSGELLSALMAADMPVCYRANGRRWLEDFQVARADQLLAMAVGADRQPDDLILQQGAA
jgi:flagellar biosynthesis protein FlhF